MSSLETCEAIMAKKPEPSNLTKLRVIASFKDTVFLCRIQLRNELLQVISKSQVSTEAGKS